MNASTNEPDHALERRRMIDAQLRARGIQDARVLRAMAEVPREEFVRPIDRVAAGGSPGAYYDGALPIGHGQTISQPLVVAEMLEALRLTGGERVLEVGAGSGYAVAVLARIVREVWGVERIAELATEAQSRLDRLGITNAHIVAGDGSVGLSEHAPYDAILVSAAAPKVSERLREQLAPGGRMVLPVGATRELQQLLLVERTDEGDRETRLDSVAFVPLIGEEGWDEDPS